MDTEPSPASPQPDLPSLCLAITEHAPLPMVTLEGATRIVRYGNPAFCLMMGRTSEAIVGKPFDELLPDKDHCVSLIDLVFRTKKPVTYTEEEPEKPHPVFWSYTIWPLREIDGLVGVMIQVTETAEIHGKIVEMNQALLLGAIRQQELTDSAELLNAQLRAEMVTREEVAAVLLENGRQLSEKARLLDLSHDGILVLDLEGRIRYWNHGAEEMYGWSREEALGKVSHHLLKTEFSTSLEQLIEELHRTDRWMGELVHTARDGRRLTVLARKTLDRDSEGHPAAVLENITDITARQQIEEALRKSEVRFRAAVGLVSSLIWTNNERGMMEGEQPGWGNFTGQTREDYQGYGWAKAVHPEDAQPTIDAWNQAVTEKRMFEFQHRVRRADGAWRLCSIRATPVLTESGAIVEWVGVHTDITDQKRSEEILRQSEERHRALITASSDVIYRMSADWSELAPIAGRDLVPSSAEPSRTWLEDNIFPEDRPEVHAAIQETISTKGVFTLEHRVRRADGSAGWTVSRAVPVCDARGEIVEWFGTANDVTERRQAEEALRASEERYRSIIDSSPDCIKVLDLEGNLLSVEAGQELLGITDLAPLLGTSWFEFWKDAGHRAAAQAAVAAAAAGGEGHFVGFFRTRHGQGKWWDVAVMPVSDVCGQPARLIAVSRDVTERHEMESLLIARAAELAQADRSKDEFLAMLAHELRNPLAPLRNATEILQTAEASAEEREQAQRIIRRQIENMSRMIDDLLDVSRITEGKIELRQEPVALEAILTAATSLVRAGCAARQQELAVSWPAAPVFLNGDATRLEQVFNNLLGNACKYSGDGCHISLSAERAEGVEPPEVIVRVRDDGAGIDAELLPRVFDLFVQATRALDRAHGGLGIGLTLVSRLVKLHGGRVEARSEGPGHGSEFIVHLPILRHAPPPPAPPPPSVARATSRRLLIVDDNTDSARSMAILQARRGHLTRTAFTGPDALTAAAEFLPEVVLLDIGLPGMDGFAVARHLRAMPALRGAFLIAMTGYGSPEDLRAAKAAGFDEYLIKPVDLDALRDWLQTRV